MPSHLITPPDVIHLPNSFLVLNALDTNISTLSLWLQTVPEDYNIHLYHSEMYTYHDWAVQIASWAPKILVEKNHIKYLVPRVLESIDRRTDAVVYFGPGSEYPELIHYFLKNRLE